MTRTEAAALVGALSEALTEFLPRLETRYIEALKLAEEALELEGG